MRLSCDNSASKLFGALQIGRLHIAIAVLVRRSVTCHVLFSTQAHPTPWKECHVMDERLAMELPPQPRQSTRQLIARLPLAPALRAVSWRISIPAVRLWLAAISHPAIRLVPSSSTTKTLRYSHCAPH